MKNSDNRDSDNQDLDNSEPIVHVYSTHYMLNLYLDVGLNLRCHEHHLCMYIYMYGSASLLILCTIYIIWNAFWCTVIYKIFIQKHFWGRQRLWNYHITCKDHQALAILVELNLAVQTSIAKPPNLIHHQYFHLYGKCTKYFITCSK